MEAVGEHESKVEDSDLNILKDHDSNLCKIVLLLADALAKPFKSSRNSAQRYLKKISSMVGLTELQLLQPAKERLKKYVLTRSLRSVMEVEQNCKDKYRNLSPITTFRAVV